MNIIELRNVCKTFGKDECMVNALKNVNLKIEEGEMIAIVGPSGSGKSTLLNVIGCLDTIDQGMYLLNNEKINDFNNRKLSKLRNKTFGFIVQYFALIDDYTVYENIKLPLMYSKVVRKNDKQAIDRLLNYLKISDKKNCYPSEISGGQSQRTAIARALVNDPQIILADEPTGALDSKTGQEVIDLFEKLNKEGKTIIIVTHDLNIAKRCKRIVRIEDGMIKDEN